jgi:hypothetical protein
MVIQYYKNNQYIGFDKQYLVDEVAYLITNLKPGLTLTVWF